MRLATRRETLAVFLAAIAVAGGRLSGALPALPVGANGVVDLMELNASWIVAGPGQSAMTPGR